MHEVTTMICLLISIMAPKYENMTMRLLFTILLVLVDCFHALMDQQIKAEFTQNGFALEDEEDILQKCK